MSFMKTEQQGGKANRGVGWLNSTNPTQQTCGSSYIYNQHVWWSGNALLTLPWGQALRVTAGIWAPALPVALAWAWGWEAAQQLASAAVQVRQVELVQR